VGAGSPALLLAAIVCFLHVPSSSLGLPSTPRRNDMRTLLIGIAAAGLVGATTAKAGEQPSTSDKSAAQPSQSQTSQTQSPAGKSMDQAPSSQTSASTSATGTTASASKELSGVVKKVDKDKRSLKISSATGGEQELKLAETATITRDGTQAGLDQIKEGDQVRASFDASGSPNKIEVSSKQKADKSDTKASDTKPQSKDKY
jgi:Cu/Ag efflux protein CusF